MAEFRFVDLKPAPASRALRIALEVDAHEPLLARRLRGTGRHDAGRRVTELIVPSWIPAVNYRADGLLNDVLLDHVSDDFGFGEYFREGLAERWRADQVVVLHRSVENPVPLAERAHERPADEPDWMAGIDWEDMVDRPIVLQCYFESPMLRDVQYWPLRVKLRIRRWQRRQNMPLPVPRPGALSPLPPDERVTDLAEPA